MMKGKRNYSPRGKFNTPVRTVKCSCGAQAKQRTSKIYPFGKKSKGTTIKFFKCPSCGKRFE